MRFKLGSWPFPAGMPAYLVWVSSPMQVGREKQWLQKVLFLGENGQYHEHTLPWGVIPVLKLGILFVDGEANERGPFGSVKQFRFGEGTTCRITLTDYIRNPWLDRVRDFQRKMLLENCVCIEEGETRLWVTCVEVARAFFAINKQMAYLLLEPMGLSRVCSSELDGKKVRVHFNSEIPVMSLNKILATRIAMIRHHPSWDHGWRQVWNRSIKNPGWLSVYSQLHCFPPILNGSTWAVRGIQCNSGFFVFEIRAVRTDDELPFDEVTYTHPYLTHSPVSGVMAEPENGKGAGVGSKGNQNASGEIDTSTKPPKSSCSPRRGSIAIPPIRFGNSVRVFKRYGKGMPRPKRSQSPGEPEEKGDVQPSEPSPVSMNGEGGSGVIQAGEFRPIEALTEVPHGLKPFMAAISKMKKAIVSCAVKPVPETSPLAKLRDGQRHFVLAHVLLLGRCHGEGYLLEIDSSDGHRVSTLVFQPKADTKALAAAISVLKGCFARGGHWIPGAVKQGEIITKHELVRHRLLDPNRWGGRLRLKVYQIN